MAKTHLEIERRWPLSGLPGPEILRAPSTNLICYEVVYIYIDEKLETRIQRRVNHKGPFAGHDPLVEPEITYPIVTKLGHGILRQETPKIFADDDTFLYYKKRKLPSLPIILYEVFLPGKKKPWEFKHADWFMTPHELGFRQLNTPVIAELEFDSMELAMAFDVTKDAPIWLRSLIEKEVTDDQRYNVSSLAQYGPPNPR